MDRSSRYTCPLCSGAVKVWADHDAEASVEISTGNKAIKRNTKAFQLGDNCGLECSKCEWKCHINEISNKYLFNKFLSLSRAKWPNYL